MKVVINLRKMSKKPSGIGIYTYNLVKILLKIKGIEIIGVTDIIESEEILELNKKLKIYVYGREVKKNLDVFKYFYYLRKILKKERPKIYWETNNIIPGYLKVKGVQIYTTIHDFFPITDSKHISKLFILYYKFFMLFTLKQSNKIICISNKTKKELLSIYKTIIKNKEIKVIYNLVENEKKQFSEIKTINQEFNLFLGTINKRKGGHILLDAYKKYVLETPEAVKLILAGSIEDETLLKKINEIKEINRETIEYRGYISNLEKENLLKECKAFIFPSLAEGFGIPPLEALLYDKPLVLSDLEIFYEVLGKDNNYFKIENNYEETVLNLVDILKSKLQKNKNSKNILKRVSTKNITQQIKEIINYE